MTAWREQRILEAFFGPVLETPSYVSKDGHQWDANQRASAERAGGGDGASYISRAEPLPIFAWPKWLFWSILAPCAAALAAPGVMRRATARSDR